jgi:hypothetical protein
VTTTHPGDPGCRVAHLRQELGLTREEVARRAEMDPGYLDYLEHSPVPAVLPGVLLRLAKALETTASSLSGGEADRPPGPGRAGPHPRLDVPSRTGCEAHLAGGGVGRFVFLSAQGPVVLPANFRLVDGDVVLRSRATGSLAAAVGATVSFEVDQIDEGAQRRLSVLITRARSHCRRPGRAHAARDRALARRPSRGDHPRRDRRHLRPHHPPKGVAVTVAGPTTGAGVDAKRLCRDPGRARVCPLAQAKGCEP